MPSSNARDTSQTLLQVSDRCQFCQKTLQCTYRGRQTDLPFDLAPPGWEWMHCELGPMHRRWSPVLVLAAPRYCPETGCPRCLAWGRGSHCQLPHQMLTRCLEFHPVCAVPIKRNMEAVKWHVHRWKSEGRSDDILKPRRMKLTRSSAPPQMK